jgi:membrane glycosyltransferase
MNRVPASLRRTWLAVGTGVLTVVAFALFEITLTRRGTGYVAVDACLHVLFGVSFAWISFWFCSASLGFAVLLRSRHAAVQTPVRQVGKLPSTAVLMPVYHEDAGRVFAGVATMLESLEKTEHASSFTFYVLSDSMNPERWAEEELAFAALSRRSFKVRCYYRRRTRNWRRKVGNLHDFFERWGARHPYAIILDADSVMTGATMVEMVRRLHTAPDVAIIQAPSQLFRRRTLYGRMQQFASSLLGPIFITGLSYWSGDDGLYWGHNAVVRTEAFARCCGLPPLPGKPPLGGPILSHDFVETALLRRRGWKVQIAWDLQGSYEEGPRDLLESAIRDRRWCQGNLQHARLVFARDMLPLSRLHFALGVMLYAASPLWAALLVLGWIAVAIGETEGPATLVRAEIGLSLLTVLLLFAPRVYAIVWSLIEPTQSQRSAGRRQLLLSTLLETAASVMTAPIWMVLHTRFVISILCGRAISWNPPSRDDGRIDWWAAIRGLWLHAVIGSVALALILTITPSLLIVTGPVWLSLILAVPFSAAMSSTALGSWFLKKRIFVTPLERHEPQILARLDDFQHVLCPRRHSAESAITRLLRDPYASTLHTALLENQPPPRPRIVLDRLLQGVMESGIAAVPPRDVLALLSDAESVERLHAHLWSNALTAPSANGDAVARAGSALRV